MESITPNLTRSVVAAVTAHIRDNDLRSGNALPSESVIAATVGVSRTGVREAFGALSALRLIDGSVMALPLGHAVYTAQVSVPQVWDARRVLERRTAELASMSAHFELSLRALTNSGFN